MPEDNTTTTPITTNDSSMMMDNPTLPPVPSDPPVPSNPAGPSDPAMPSDPANPANNPIPSAPLDAPVPTPSVDYPTPSAPEPDTGMPISPTIVDPFSPDTSLQSAPRESAPSIYQEVASKISESHNVLIALSSDPSVDEMCAAIGLSLYLDKLGKRATAIYSGSTPNALEFLKPEETFESTADTLQDFVIALSKEKADHLRYKLDGDYVKIYITPYRTKITAEDLEFSYGDFNVDLVLALDVSNGIDLDSALREHGRIMHDAVIINITTGNPGKFGEIEWSDKRSSSVSEMIAKLLYSVKSDVEIGKEEATAFLTGIVAATNRFSNAQTTPETMQLSSRLMKSGANQQLIAKNITPDIDNELYSLLSSAPASDKSSAKPKDPTNLNIQHGNEKEADDSKEVEGTVTEKESTLLSDLKAAEASLAQTGAETTPDSSNQPVRLDAPADFELKDSPSADLEPSISEPNTPEPNASEPDTPESGISELTSDDGPSSNPAIFSAPEVASSPEINGVPEMNFMPPADEAILPPPPTPPIDMSATSPDDSLPTTPIEPATPVEEPTPEPLGPQPSMQDQVYRPQASDPGAFQIPGM